MFFSFEQFATLNRWLGGFWRLILLNLLWTAVTLLGLGLFGIGPASYALAKYLDRWFRHGLTPPTVRTFLRDARERPGASIAMGLVLSAAGVVIGVNLLSLSDWYLRAANHLALAVLLIIGAYVFFVMAATEVRGIRRQIGGALLLGIGSLHWTIIGALAVVVAETVMLRFAVALFPLLGAVLPFLVVALILRPVLSDLDRTLDAEPGLEPDPATLTKGHPA
jgi:uncharacterized membrane protein YesL